MQIKVATVILKLKFFTKAIQRKKYHRKRNKKKLNLAKSQCKNIFIQELINFKQTLFIFIEQNIFIKPTAKH